MIFAIFSRLAILLLGTLYPAYASYKAVRTKNVKEYVKWMMYWIVFALFTCIETVTDILLSWFPFYYELKVVVVLWLMSPATRGSSTLYRKFVHPMLTRREQEIDDYINQAKEKGYMTVVQLAQKGITYAKQTAIQSFTTASSMPYSQSDNTLAASASHSSQRTCLPNEKNGSVGQSCQVDGPAQSAGSTRVRRSKSADSALNKAAASKQPPNVANYSIIYEIESEEEEQWLVEAQEAIEQSHLSINDIVDRARISSSKERDFEKESSPESETSSARSRPVQKKKTATSAAGRGRKPNSASNGTATSKTVSTRGRRKLRKDSEC